MSDQALNETVLESSPEARSATSGGRGKRHASTGRALSAALFSLALGAATLAGSIAASAAETVKPTIVLVHGAFADSSSWNGVVTRLAKDGYHTIAAANPLRGVKTDAQYVASIVASIHGPVVLVGHSYGGEVISVAADGASNVKALVFVAGLAPDIGEGAGDLAARFPTGTLGQALAPPVPLPDGQKDLYIDQSKFWHQFAADVPEAEALQMAVAQRPVTEAGLSERVEKLSWKTLPSWFIYGSLDKNIPNTLHAFMAKRANARETVEVKGASHVVMISHPAKVAAMIEHAASAP